MTLAMLGSCNGGVKRGLALMHSAILFRIQNSPTISAKHQQNQVQDLLPQHKLRWLLRENQIEKTISWGSKPLRSFAR